MAALRGSHEMRGGPQSGAAVCVFPADVGSLTEARAFCAQFFAVWTNQLCEEGLTQLDDDCLKPLDGSAAAVAEPVVGAEETGSGSASVLASGGVPRHPLVGTNAGGCR